MIEVEGWKRSGLRDETCVIHPKIDVSVTFVIGRSNDSPWDADETAEASRLFFQITQPAYLTVLSLDVLR